METETPTKKMLIVPNKEVASAARNTLAIMAANIVSVVDMTNEDAIDLAVDLFGLASERIKIREAV